MRPSVKPLVVLAGLALVELALQPLGCPLGAGADCGAADPVSHTVLFIYVMISLLILMASIDTAAAGVEPPQCNPARLPWLAGAMCLLTGWAAGTF